VNVRSRWLAVSLVVLVALAACGGGAESTPLPTSTPEAASPSPSASASPAAEHPIVGEWVAIHDCGKIVAMLKGAGLDEFLADAVYGNELVPGIDPATTELNDDPCDGAVERQHAHFFTADGRFGSRDFNGDTVDSGTYTLEGEHGIVINSSRFTYAVNGDELSLDPEPVDISACTTPQCRFEATWVLMVALPGTTWKKGRLVPA
jgi:hypothetical protein